MNKDLVRADDLGVVLGGRPVLEAISFTVCAGELVGVIGPNGAGKTTLLRVILGLVSYRRGSLTVLGVSGGDLRSVRPGIGYMPQRQSFERRFPLSSADVVFTGLLAPRTIMRRVSPRASLVREALQSVGMEHFYHRPFQSLSGGEQQRVLLARALVRRPRLLLLDEPGAGLDFPAQHEFLALLEKLKREEGLGIILVSHDLVSVAAAADRLICINRTMHLHGRPAEVLHSPHLDQAYRCQFDFLSALGEETGCSN